MQARSVRPMTLEKKTRLPIRVAREALVPLSLVQF
jgi:hypothetical protein